MRYSIAFLNQTSGARHLADIDVTLWGIPLPRISVPRGTHLEAICTIRIQAENIMEPSGWAIIREKVSPSCRLGMATQRRSVILRERLFS